MNISETPSKYSPVKRTFWFGMLSLPVSVFCILSVITILLLIGASNPNDMVLLKRDESIYNALFALFKDGYIYVLAPTVCILLTVWLGWSTGFLNKENIRFWVSIPRYVRERAGGVRGTVVRLAIVSLAVVAAYLRTVCIFIPSLLA